MALDFPASPTVGQKYPASPLVGVPTYAWDGEKWITGNVASIGTHVLKAGDTMTGALVLPADPTLALQAALKQYVDGKRTRYDLSGKYSQDVQVPAGAIGVRYTAHLYPGSAADVHLLAQLSIAAGVFLATPGQYNTYGFSHQTAASPTDVNPAAGITSFAGLFLTPGGNVSTIPMICDGSITLKRPSASDAFASDARAIVWGTTVGVTHGFYYSYGQTASFGSVLAVLAIRFTMSNTVNLRDGSHLTVEFF